MYTHVHTYTYSLDSKVWKWKSPLTPSQCDSAWKAAEELNDYGEYSKFGSEFPTLDVSLDKLPPRMAPM